jgi:lipopolysaccharide biosynthesis protein
MNGPIEQFLNRPDDKFQYMINWANENLTKKWDGQKSEIILEQIHTEKDDEAFFNEILPHLKSKKYLRVKGRIPLLIYRPSLMIPHLEKTLMRWRTLAKTQGVGDLLLLRSNLDELEYQTLCDCAAINEDPFDGVVQFPPHGNFDRGHLRISRDILFNNQFSGKLFDYQHLANRFISECAINPTLYPGVIPSWDNSARMGHDAIIYINSNPKIFQEWLSVAIKSSVNNNQNIVFINAWNEWGEGAHLEPCSWYGYAHIESTRAAVLNANIDTLTTQS